ncbi:hypothetical protein Tco_1086465 [Tanacetum coccineum]
MEDDVDISALAIEQYIALIPDDIKLYCFVPITISILSMGQMLFLSSVPDTELVLYPLQDKLTSGDKRLDYLLSNYPAYSSVSYLQGPLVVGDRMRLSESIAISH